MIRFRILGKRISMSEERWTQLKQRFDEKDAVFVTQSHHPAYVDQRWEIKISCPWCGKYRKKLCEGCVWDKAFHDRILGCTYVLQVILKKKYGIESCHSKLGSVIYLGYGGVVWTRGVDKEARQILRCIQKEFEIIEARRIK